MEESKDKTVWIRFKESEFEQLKEQFKPNEPISTGIRRLLDEVGIIKKEDRLVRNAPSKRHIHLWLSSEENSAIREYFSPTKKYGNKLSSFISEKLSNPEKPGIPVSKTYGRVTRRIAVHVAVTEDVHKKLMYYSGGESATCALRRLIFERR